MTKYRRCLTLKIVWIALLLLNGSLCHQLYIDILCILTNNISLAGFRWQWRNWKKCDLTTYHIAEQSKLTKSHLCGLKLNESANFKINNRKKIAMKPHHLIFNLAYNNNELYIKNMHKQIQHKWLYLIPVTVSEVVGLLGVFGKI